MDEATKYPEYQEWRKYTKRKTSGNDKSWHHGEFEWHFGEVNIKYLTSYRFLLPIEEIKKMEPEQIQIEHQKYWYKFYCDFNTLKEKERKEKMFSISV